MSTSSTSTSARPAGVHDECVLVTGGTGFAGSHLVEALLQQGYTNIHVTSFSGKPDSLANLLPAENCHQVDLTDQAAVAELIKSLQPQHIYHLAAHAAVGSSFEQGQTVLENNLKLQLSVLEGVRHCTPSARILVIGSGMEYDLIPHGQNASHQNANSSANPSSAPQTQPPKISELHPLGPVSPYAVSKVIQDLLGLSYAYSYKLDVVRARPFNHIGERQTTDFAVPSFAKQIADIERGKQQEIRVGNLDAIRDFTDVKDVALAYILLMEKGETGEVYNIGSGIAYSMQRVLEMMCHLSKVAVQVTIDQSKVRPLDVPAIIADISKVQKLGWEPKIPLPETLLRILEEWRGKL